MYQLEYHWLDTLSIERGDGQTDLGLDGIKCSGRDCSRDIHRKSDIGLDVDFYMDPHLQQSICSTREKRGATLATQQMSSTDTPLWTPSSPEHSQTVIFRNHINSKYHLSLSTYEDLWKWSCTHRATFWSEVWDWEKVIGTKGAAPFVDETLPPSANPDWFPHASLNWAENQLRHVHTHPDDIAIIQTSEHCAGWEPPARKITQKELYELVGKTQRSMKAARVGKGDRVAFWGGNCAEAVVVLLAASSLGAIFSSAAADFGVDGVVERLEQVGVWLDIAEIRFDRNCCL